uniref:Cilia- and flagella-associated protein 58 central coiled coil domain-containing protein n=1 Tax=Phaeomonas parva TaxID=124430 RepID=A0A7S1TS05_9STRA
MKGGADEGELSATQIEQIEREFQDVVADLVGDANLERFRIEYEKLYRALKKSHDQEKRLVRKCRELNTEIVNNAAKVQTALKLSQEDQARLAALQKDIEKAWKMVDLAHEKEVRARETITQLREEINNLSVLVEKGAGLSVGQEQMVKELTQQRDELARQNEEQTAQLRTLDTQLHALAQNRDDLDAEVEEKTDRISSLEEDLAHREGELQREHRRRERMDKELREVRQKLDKKTVEEIKQKDELGKSREQVAQLDGQLNEARVTMEKHLREFDSLCLRTQKLTDDLEDQVQKNKDQQLEISELSKDKKEKHNEINRITTEKSQLERRAARERREVERYKDLLEQSKTPLLMAQNEIQTLNKELDMFRRKEEAIKKEMEGVERDRNLQIKSTQRAEQRTKETEDVLREQERVSHSLEAEMNNYRVEIGKLRKIIYQLEKEREKYGTEASEQRNLYQNTLEEVKLRNMRIAEQQKKLTEWEGKLKQQQQLYESVRSDRNLYSKNLIEAQDEIAEMKRKFKIMTHQVEQLQEEITAKDNALVKQHFDLQRIEKGKEREKHESDRTRRLLRANDEIIQKQDSEIRNLAAMIRRLDDEASVQKKEYDQVVNERDILGTQLIRRNDELALVYEKVKIQTATLEQGKTQYNARMQDVRLLRLKCKDLTRELNLARSGSDQTDDMKREVIVLQKELLQEKTKVKALSEELENPLNVHRWRKLEGSDPATYEMIQKIQTLQKRLISKTEECVERDLLIAEKEKLYLELKNILARQPGPEVAEQLSIYQGTLRDKTRQMKAMASELNMYKAQVNEHRYEIERLTRELQEVKRRYYEHRRRQQLAQDAEDQPLPGRAQARSQLAAAQGSSTRFTGGGFAIK